jgi:hypothetical protein
MDFDVPQCCGGERGLERALALTQAPAAVSSSILEACRGAILKNARQKAIETHTQGIRMSTMGLNMAPSRGTAN